MFSAQERKVKHYEVPNMSSMLYEYTNREKDYVERAFRGGNYQTIRALPDDIRPFNVGQAVKEKIANAALFSSIIGQNNHVYQELLKGDGGVFSKFQWQADSYNNAKEQESMLRMTRQSKQQQVHGNDQFNPSQLKKCLKYEYPFLGRDEVSTRNFLMAEDPYA